MKKSIWWIVGIAIVVVMVIAMTNKKPTESGNIRFGFIGPLTGDAAAYGADTVNAAQIAVDEINSSGGIDGRKIELVTQDGKCTAQDGLSSAQKLINIDGVKFIVSSSCSGELLGYSALAEQSKVLALNTLASSPNVTNAGDVIFRNAPSDSDGGKQLADLVVRDSKKVAVITENTEYAQGIRKVFTETFEKNGGAIALDESYSPESTDFRSILLKVKSANPDAIFLNPQTPANGARLASQARQLGLNQQFYLAYMSGPEFVVSGPSAEGAYIVDVPGLYGEKGTSLLAKFKSLYGREPGYPYFVGSTYDAVYILKQAIEAVGTDTIKVKDYLYQMPEFDGAAGRYRFDKNGDLMGVEFVVRKVVGQKTVEVK